MKIKKEISILFWFGVGLVFLVFQEYRFFWRLCKVMIEEIKERRSVREYKDKEVEEEKIDEILKAAAFAPSAQKRYAYELITLEEEDVRRKLSDVTPYADFLEQATLGIVVASKAVDNWIEDCSVVAENIQLEATGQGLGSCWIQIRGHSKEEKKSEEIVKNLLNIPDDRRVLCIISIGHPNEKKSPHKESELLEREIYKEKHGNNYYED